MISHTNKQTKLNVSFLSIKVIYCRLLFADTEDGNFCVGTPGVIISLSQLGKFTAPQCHPHEPIMGHVEICRSHFIHSPPPPPPISLFCLHRGKEILVSPEQLIITSFKKPAPQCPPQDTALQGPIMSCLFLIKGQFG